MLLKRMNSSIHDKLISLLHSSPSNLLKIKALHSLFLVSGFFNATTPIISKNGHTIPLFGSHLVNLYAKFGNIVDSLLLFHQLPVHQKSNTISWNSILRNFLSLGLFHEVISLFKMMVTQDLVLPDNYTYPLALKACSAINDLEQGKKIKILIEFYHDYRDVPNIYVQCAMIDMFAKCGSLREALNVFVTMPHRDLASWTAIICGTVQNGDCAQAISLFKRMRFEGIQPDSVVVAAVLPACSRLEYDRNKGVGMALQGCAVRGGFGTDLFVSNALIDMYCKCGDTLEAQFVFSSMAHKDVVSWGTLIAGYSQNCEFKKSIELYTEMTMLGLRDTAVTVASVLPSIGKLRKLKQGKEMHNFILKQGFENDIVVMSALIDMYANCGSSRKARHVYDTILCKDVTLCNSMIVGNSVNEDFDSAFKVFRELWECKLKPNYITLVSILPICTKLGVLKQGKEIHGHATKAGLLSAISVGNCLIDMYCKCGYLELGVRVFDYMMDKNVVTYNTIISAFGIHGYTERAFMFFDQMGSARIRPTKLTFTALLSACSHAGLIHKGWSFYKSMINDYGMQPQMEHYSCMVDLLGRAGHINEAYDFIDGMPIEPDMDIWGSLLGACSIHSNIKLAEVVGRRILQSGLKDSGCHILLSNLYASAEKWEDASKSRVMIKENGLTKKPGQSWIHIDRRIYTFKARHITHPEFDTIYQVLESLLLEMKKDECKSSKILLLPS